MQFLGQDKALKHELLINELPSLQLTHKKEEMQVVQFILQGLHASIDES